MTPRTIHSESLATSTALAGYYVKNFITPLDVIRVLHEAGVKFMLVGAHGLGGWIGAPRATKDVDVLVGTRGCKKAIRAIAAAFPHLEVDDQEVVTQFTDPQSKQVVIDVLKPNQPLYREALKHTCTGEAKGQTYAVPSLEMALAMKFAPMIGPNRMDEKKHQDAHDFIRMVRVNADIDLEQLAELGELVYPGRGKEILVKVRQVRAGEPLTL